jgi:DNA-binding NarL/FixJ family response regulator
MTRTRVLVADNHSFALDQWSALLEPEFEVVASVADGLSLVEAARQLRPDVVLTDITMPMLDGLSAAERILAAAPKTLVLFVTVHADPVLVQRSLQTGAAGYVLKPAAGEDLVTALRAALAGKRFVSVFPTGMRGRVEREH